MIHIAQNALFATGVRLAMDSTIFLLEVLVRETIAYVK